MCLPINDVDNDGDLDNLDFAGMEATVTGWGTETEGVPSQVSPHISATNYQVLSIFQSLMEVEMKVLSNEECKTDYNYTENSILDSILCAHVPGGGAGACLADKGVTSIQDDDSDDDVDDDDDYDSDNDDGYYYYI